MMCRPNPRPRNHLDLFNRYTDVADAQGFLAITDCLQSEGGPSEVFAAGDVASCAKHPRPKAGVFAVRQVRPHEKGECAGAKQSHKSGHDLAMNCVQNHRE